MGRANPSGYERCKRLKGVIIGVLLAIIGVMMIGFSQNYSAGCSATANYSNTAKVVIESISKRILNGGNYHARLPMASTTKVMTAYLACISGKLDNKVTIPKEACGIEGSSIYLVPSEEVTLRDLTYGLMLRSGNDSAVAIALYLGGSVEGFANMMNGEAIKLGALNTNFTNPHGLHDDNHYTSAYDLANITATALQNSEFKSIVSSKSYIIKSSTEPPRYIANKNKMLSLYPYSTGVKTGFTKKAGRCLVSSAERDGVELVTVVLNVGDMWNESINLFDNAFKKCKSVTLATKDVELMKVRLPKSDIVVPIAIKNGYSRVVINGDNLEVTHSVEFDKNLKLPLKKGDNIGRLQLFSENHLLFETNIYTMIDVIQKERTR